jgi:hypothetical protein
MNQPLLITYYNTIPENATNYFTILNGTIQISNNDLMEIVVQHLWKM